MTIIANGSVSTEIPVILVVSQPKTVKGLGIDSTCTLTS